jgi:uncharacterized repeat protein (TIGR03833 family)
VCRSDDEKREGKDAGASWLAREFSIMDGQQRKDVRPGLTVEIVLKQDQRTGRRTRGVIKDILTTSPHHPHGIKVRLETGEVGRVKEIVEES